MCPTIADTQALLRLLGGGAPTLARMGIVVSHRRPPPAAREGRAQPTDLEARRVHDLRAPTAALPGGGRWALGAAAWARGAPGERGLGAERQVGAARAPQGVSPKKKQQ